MVKRCFRCQLTLPLSEFYKHPKMADGHLGKCKACAREDVRQNRLAKSDYYVRYDRARAMDPQRVDARREYLGTPRGRVARKRALTNHKERHPERDKARQRMSNALRSGSLVRQPCVFCGAKAEAHHEDYSKPLDVWWLCSKHHHARHRAIKEIRG